MHKHHGRHNDPTHHAHILMYGHRSHHAAGGAAPGNMPSNTPTYKKGGHPHRKRHAEGDMAGTNPITGTRSPDIIAKRKGGRACHAEGDVVAQPYGHGGKTHRHHKRRRHAEGEEVEQKHSDGGAAALLRHGGPSRHRRRHAEGDRTEMMARGGCKKKSLGREHHDFGDVIGKIAGVAGNLLPLLPMFLEEGGSAKPRKLAAGGAGKIRKGMLSKSGKILKAPIHSPMHMPFTSR
jgi:hypothetical protein